MLHFGPHLKDKLDLAIVHQLDRGLEAGRGLIAGEGLMVGVGRGLMTGRGPMAGMGMGLVLEAEKEWALERDMELPVLDKVLLVLDSSPLLRRKGADMRVAGTQ